MSLLRRITRLEVAVALVVAVVLAVLVAIEPGIVEAPFENGRTIVFSLGGTALAAAALVVMLWLRVPAGARILVLGAPFVAVSWWLLSPFFVDERVDDEFETTIAAAAAEQEEERSTPRTAATSAPETVPPQTAPPASAGPVLLAHGPIVGLAGHEGRGDAAFFETDTGTVLRLEDTDIQNGPDLHLYVVPGADRRQPGDGLYLGPLRGNVGDQTYELPPDVALTPGDWTVLVWCEAFSVEFVGATVTIT